MKHAAGLAALFLIASCSRPQPGPSGNVPPQASEASATAAAPLPGSPFALESPYRAKARAYRGQLHAHTTNSDGRQPPAAVMEAYRDHGYDFVAVSDHDFNTPDPRIPGILFIPGVENDHSCLHENRIGATTVAPGARRPQDVIDQAIREGSFVQINHPDWPGRYPGNPCWSDAALLAVHGYDAVEAWNASNDPWNSNAEKRIDYLLSHGRRTDLTAVDDCHDVRAAYCMTASVYVFADALTSEEILANLKAGNFYSSAGANITSVTAEDGIVAVTVPAPSDVEFIADGGAVVATARNAASARYAATGAESYVRVRVTRLSDGRKAWTNPVYVSRTPSPH
ncbi:MAG TPA: CehA/McbA family metallohydrolase [Patescibacteria group bacterium]|nr:CehA/McbA family metallohydrolase [Patescibacteria group bacterium]